VRPVQLPRARRPEPLPRVRRVPHVQVPHLRPFRRRDPAYAALRHDPRAPGADGDEELGGEGASVRGGGRGGDAGVEGRGGEEVGGWVGGWGGAWGGGRGGHGWLVGLVIGEGEGWFEDGLWVGERLRMRSRLGIALNGFDRDLSGGGRCAGTEFRFSRCELIGQSSPDLISPRWGKVEAC